MITYDVTRSAAALTDAGEDGPGWPSMAAIAHDIGETALDVRRAVATVAHPRWDDGHPWLVFNARDDVCKPTTTGWTVVEEWRHNPTLTEHKEKLWIARARAGRINGPCVVPTGDTRHGVERDRLADFERLSRRLLSDGLTGEEQWCSSCERLRPKADFGADPYRCRECEARRQRMRRAR